MITPGLFRRALAHGAQWRLLVLFCAALLVPALLGVLPLAALLGSLLGHSPRAVPLAHALDGAGAIDIARALSAPTASTGLAQGIFGALLVALLLAPALSGAAVAAAGSERRLDFRELLRGAGQHYGRLLRLSFVAVLPLGVAGGVAFAGFRFATSVAQRAALESQAVRASRLAAAVSAVGFFLAQATLESARAHLAAQPGRRSAFLSWWAGVKLLLRHPLRGFGLYLLATFLALAACGFFLVLRQRLDTGSAAGAVFAFALAQLSVAAVGWGRASRIAGLAELVRLGVAERVERARRGARFVMAPPRTSPPPTTPPEPPAWTPPSPPSPMERALSEAPGTAAPSETRRKPGG